MIEIAQKKRIDVTIVMAVYNAEKWLRETLDSIVNQKTEYSYNLLAFNDGSKDGSLLILQEYQRRYPGIICVIDQSNSGYAATLNCGFHMAQSRYIANLDSDDIQDEFFIQKLVSTADATGADVTLCCYNLYNSFAKTEEEYLKHYTEPFYNDMHDENPIPVTHVTVDLMDAPDHPFRIADFPGLMAKHHSLWAGIWRREFVQDNNLRMPETDSAAYQDVPFFALALTYNPLFAIIKENLVNYRFEPNQGNSMQATGKKCVQMAVMCKMAFDILKDGDKIPLLAGAMLGHAVVKNRAPYRRINEFKDEFIAKLGALYLEILEYVDPHEVPFLANPGDKEFVDQIVLEYAARQPIDEGIKSLKRLRPQACDLAFMKQFATSSNDIGLISLVAKLQEAEQPISA